MLDSQEQVSRRPWTHVWFLECSNACLPVFFHRLIFFGGYGYAPQGPHQGSFEFDESSSFGVCEHPFFHDLIITFSFSTTKVCFFSLPLQWDSPGRGWNNHIHILDLETSTWSQPITTVSTRLLKPLHRSSAVV